jgi:hypothetical protein
VRDVVKVVKTPLTLVGLLALVAFGGVWGWKNATAAVPPRPPEPCVATNVNGRLTPHFVSVRVLNAGFKGGLAKRASTWVRSRGFLVIKVNNSERRLAETTIIGNAATDPEVKLVAGFFKNAKVEGDGRADHVVDILLGAEFVGFNETPVSSIAVPGPVCLPKPLVSSLITPTSVAPRPSTTPATPRPTPTRK